MASPEPHHKTRSPHKPFHGGDSSDIESLTPSYHVNLQHDSSAFFQKNLTAQISPAREAHEKIYQKPTVHYISSAPKPPHYHPEAQSHLQNSPSHPNQPIFYKNPLNNSDLLELGASDTKIRICTKNGFWVYEYEFLHCSDCKKPPYLNARGKGQPGKYNFYNLTKKYIYAIDTNKHVVIRSDEDGNTIELYDFNMNEDSEENLIEDSSEVVGLKA
jgi:hypothetical protein